MTIRVMLGSRIHRYQDPPPPRSPNNTRTSTPVEPAQAIMRTQGTGRRQNTPHMSRGTTKKRPSITRRTSREGSPPCSPSDGTCVPRELACRATSEGAYRRVAPAPKRRALPSTVPAATLRPCARLAHPRPRELSGFRHFPFGINGGEGQVVQRGARPVHPPISASAAVSWAPTMA
jgi:hypothetical protein